MIVVCVAGYVAIQHYRASQRRPMIVSNRALLLSRAETALRADPDVADLVYNAADDQWDVTPATADADPRAFGRYVCFMLAQGGVARPHTVVRVIDAAKLQATDFDYAAASRGILSCGEQQ